MNDGRCSWCDSPFVVFLTIPTEGTMYGCGQHARRLTPLVGLRALEVGLTS